MSISLLAGLAAVTAIGQALEDPRKESNGSAQAGATTIVQTCSACHSLKYIAYNDLLNLGIGKQQLDELRGDNDLLSHIAAQLPEDVAKETYGVIPPDLSLMASAREGGADYIYRMLTSFYQTPQGTTDNHAFAGTRMPDILGISYATDPQTMSQIRQTAHDATAFLEWAADPKANERVTLGYYVIGYLLFLTVILYFWKREIWKDVTD